jgi:hypothetical protein
MKHMASGAMPTFFIGWIPRRQTIEIDRCDL